MLLRFLSVMVLVFCVSGRAQAGGTFAFTLDNDVPYATDREYSNGGFFSYTTDVNQAPGFLKKFLRETLKAEDFQLQYGFGQWIYTPVDKQETAPIPDERPYAGLLYSQIEATYARKDLIHRVSFMLGVFGPPAVAEEVQNFVHSVRGLPRVLGWDNQLKTEPALNINYDVAAPFYLLEADEMGFLVEPYLGVSLGNISTSLRAGAGFRLGPDLEGQPAAVAMRIASQAPSLFIPQKKFRWHLHANALGRVEAYSTLIDGNLFRSGGPSADRKALQWEGRLGVLFSYGRYWAGAGSTFISRSHGFQERFTHKVFELRAGVSLF